MKHLFADLHIHVGRTPSGKPVKITGSKSLTIDTILHTAAHIKGLDLVGVIDCHVPEIITQLELKIQREGYELEDGGLQFGEVTLLLGSEIEVYDDNCRSPIHVLVYLPTIEKMKQFSLWLSSRMTNVHLSSQRLYGYGKQLQEKVKELGGLFIPAHVFTPFKSLYGKGVKRSLCEVFEPKHIDAIELGLSSNVEMADQIKELHGYTFVTNSDAHSLKNIGREYQKMQMKKPSFKELELTLHNQAGRKIVSYYGLDPKLGKYYRTTCQHCYTKKLETNSVCSNCGNSKWVQGVYERLQQLKDTNTVRPERPPYIEQIPLEFFPGVGIKTLEKLRKRFGTDMNILHHVSYEQLIEVIPKKLAEQIVRSRFGKIKIIEGGGGKYGKLN